MLSNNVLASSLSALVALAPTLALALPPQTAYLEKSKVVATGKTIKAYRVPMTDFNGKVRYRDVTINLGVSDTGQADPLTTVVKDAPSPNVRTNQFVPGNYTWDTWSCVVNHSILDGGRAQMNANCTAGNAEISLTWITGSISGHPYKLQLEAANIGLVPGYQNFGWGIVNGSSTASSGACFYSSTVGDVFAASQVGDTIQLTRYGDDNSPDCGWTLSPAVAP